MVFVINNQGNVEHVGSYEGALEYFRKNSTMQRRSSCTVSLWVDDSLKYKSTAPVWCYRNESNISISS